MDRVRLYVNQSLRAPPAIAISPSGSPLTVPFLRAVVYLRVSTSKQADKAEDKDGYSLPAQREACYRKAEQLGAEVVDTYVDRGESACTLRIS